MFSIRPLARQIIRRSLSTKRREIDMPKIKALYDRIMWLDVIELQMLNAEVQQQLGMNMVFHDGPVGPAGGGAAAAEEEVKEEKTTFDLKLVGFDAKAKIKVIKEVRTIAGLGLKEAKEMVESAPSMVKTDLKKEEADELKAKLEELGATVEVS
mmetsp:Transcript_32669/g.49238  ORF Transcript_32669/g.49238 Transcript_32669/m.49238 type:complete len:154 (-) Transcript_32669:109-570(-)